jgi:hypothetical protein
MDAQLRRQFAARGDAIAGLEFAGMHQAAKLVAQLDIQWNVAFWL